MYDDDFIGPREFIGPPPVVNDFHARVDDVIRIASWFFRRHSVFFVQAQLCGGVDHVVQQVWVDLASGRAAGKYLPFATLVCNQARWTLYREFYEKLPKERYAAYFEQDFDEYDLIDEGADDPFESAHLGEVRESIERVINGETYRRRQIMKLRYGLGDGFQYTLEETGKVFGGITRERVRQLEAVTKNRMKGSPEMMKHAPGAEHKKKPGPYPLVPNGGWFNAPIGPFMFQYAARFCNDSQVPNEVARR